MELHGVFAYTIYGDKVRVLHYVDDWHYAVQTWDFLDLALKQGHFPLVKFFCVRTYDDPEWNRARYRPVTSLVHEQPIAA